jgi:indole-3-glycerol phosphate synthase
VIAEVKRRSPSVGPIAPSLDPAVLAAEYATGGAAAVSVLTEPSFFGGSKGDLHAVRSATTLPVLRKDFVLDPAQVWESRAMGADAVLLIVAILDDETLGRCVEAADAAGIAVLVEIHHESEALRAMAAGARIVGVNNRDLTTFDVDVSRAERMRGLLAADTLTVAESGVSSPETARRMADAGYDAVLIGEAAVTADDPSAFVASIAGLR